MSFFMQKLYYFLFNAKYLIKPPTANLKQMIITIICFMS